MRFRLVPKLSTLDDLELLQVHIFSEVCATCRVWEATAGKRMKIDPHFQRRKCCAPKVIFSDVYNYDVDIAWRSYVRNDLVSCF